MKVDAVLSVVVVVFVGKAFLVLCNRLCEVPVQIYEKKDIMVNINTQ